jgi:integrase
MALTVRKRKGSPYYQITGSIKGYGRVRESTGIAKLNDARQAAVELEQRIRQSIKTDIAERTLSDAIIKYVNSTGKKQYLAFINELLGKRPLHTINQEMIDDTANKAFNTYRRGPNGRKIPYSKATIKRQFYTPLAAVLHHAHDIGWIPYIRVKMPKTARPAPKWANEAWFEAFFKHASDEAKAISIFLAGTGCRISETLNLKTQEVEPKNSTGYVRTTKNGSPREVYFPPFVMQAIKPYLKGDRVFDMYNSHHNVNNELRRIAKKAGIEYLSTHKVGSHTYATNLAKYGKMDAKALTETGRWKDPKSTHHYTHYLKREQAEKADVLKKLFKK